MDVQNKIWFEEILFPRRSLEPNGFRVLMGAIFILSLIIGIMFYSLGAWPVSGFFGLDVLLIYWAFKVHYEQGKAAEIIRLSDDKLTIIRIDHKGKREDWQFNPYWVNVSMACPPNVPKNIGETFIQARSHGKGTFFGTFLTQEKREELMHSLKQAIVDCKNYRPI